MQNERFQQPQEYIVNQGLEKIQRSLLFSQQKLDLALLLLERKQGAIIIDTGTANSEISEAEKEKLVREFTQKLLYIIGILNSLNLYHQISKEPSVDNGSIGFSILVSKDKATLAKLDKADKEKDDRSRGLILGYPLTAVEAYVTDKKFNWQTELPGEEVDQLRSEGMFPFLCFETSKEHWHEELEWARKNQQLIKERAPELFSELLEVSHNSIV